MSFSFQHRPTWHDVLNPLQEQLNSQLKETKQKNEEREQNIQEGTHLAQALEEIKSLGGNASAEDIIGRLLGAQQKGVNPAVQRDLRDQLLKNRQSEQGLAQKRDTQNKGREGSISPQDLNLSAERPINDQIKEYLKSQNEGLTPAEIFKAGSERYKTGLPRYEEAGKKLRQNQDNNVRLNELDKLNESKKLPKDFGRLNVNSDGNLRLPFLANKESEKYVKILNEFSAGAKETFGARVTNFDLTQYLKRFPTLLNSEEGRRDIVKHMKMFNEMNALWDKNLQTVYKMAGGARHIDSDVAQAFADQMTLPEVQERIKAFDTLSTPEPKNNLPKKGSGEGAEIPGEPSGWRSQEEKPKEKIIQARHKKFPKDILYFPESEFPRNDMDLEIMNQ